MKKIFSKPLFTVLIVVMLAAVMLSVWLFASPSLDMKQRADQQNELLNSIAQGDGTITIPELHTDAEVDYYDDDSDAPDEEVVMLLPVTMPEPAQKSEPATATQIVETTAQANTSVIKGIGVLTLDAIDLRLPVAEGCTKNQLNIAVGHVPQTAAIGGIGNAVIAGHRSYEYGKFFNRLGEVKNGDIIEYQPKDGEIMRFVVYEILVIEPGDQNAFTQPEDKSIITLYTCTPIKKATHRLLIRAELSN